MPAPDIVISGYYGFGNVGDELVLSGMLAELRALRPEVNCAVVSGSPGETERWHQVRAVSRWSLPGAAAVLSGRLLISGGGGLFQDQSGSGSVPYYAGMMAASRACGRRVMAYAHGLDEFRTRRAARMAGFALRLADAVTVRDESSLARATALGVSPERLTLSADPAIPVLARLAGSAAPPSRLSRIGVALRPTGREGGREDEAWARALDVLASELACELVFIPCRPETDLGLCLAVRRRVSARAEVVEWRHPTDLAGLVEDGDLLIALRFHAALAALAASRPVVVVAAYPKLAELARGLILPVLSRSEALAGALVAAARSAWEGRAASRSAWEAARPLLEERARRSARVAEHLIF